MSEQEQNEQQAEERPLTHNEALGIRTINDVFAFIWDAIKSTPDPQQIDTTRSADE
ncbi:hypothetical protein [Ktedonospora formicarum]|uniref:Uncharacterized protein n=1 Tax=Ktedonospora formicarum TaxID=2778364 RepID=A0A8J3IHU4_9CHLR|nr:hypothetical protein [Ktedonospora formicarum]GHO51429.1 hypothetical protein KSX_95920 [Ktedonospora formicarum]